MVSSWAFPNRRLHELSIFLGPIVSIRVLFRKLIIINDPNLVSELFEKRAAQYSDRDVPELARLCVGFH